MVRSREFIKSCSFTATDGVSLSEIISPFLSCASLALPLLPLSVPTQWTCNPVSSGPVGGRGGGSHAAPPPPPQSHSSIQSLLYFPLGMIAHAASAEGRPREATRRRCRCRVRMENGLEMSRAATAAFFTLLSAPNRPTKTNPALFSFRRRRRRREGGRRRLQSHKSHTTQHTGAVMRFVI